MASCPSQHGFPFLPTALLAQTGVQGAGTAEGGSEVPSPVVGPGTPKSREYDGHAAEATPQIPQLKLLASVAVFGLFSTAGGQRCRNRAAKVLI